LYEISLHIQAKTTLADSYSNLVEVFWNLIKSGVLDITSAVTVICSDLSEAILRICNVFITEKVFFFI